MFEYLDYRALLADFYRTKKAEGRGFSFRAFARRAGLRSPNHLKRVIDGERNLTPEMSARYAQAMGLEGDEAIYFCDLVTFNQARSSTDRNAAYQRLTGFRGYRRAHRLDLAHAAYHADWYIPAVRELAARSDFLADPGWIAARMVPSISVSKARRALDTLFELGLLERREDGRVVQTEEVVSTGAETRGLHIANYHRAMLERAAEAIDLVPAADRDISSLTLCVAEDGLRRIKTRIQRFRQELLALSAQDDEGSQVVQVGMQVFPLSTRREDDREEEATR